MARDSVALFLVNETLEYQQLVKTDAEAAARRLGLDFEAFDAKSDPARQIQQIYGCINREPGARPRVLVLLPVRDSPLLRVARDAARNGIGWLVLNRRADYVEQLHREFPNLPFGRVGPDQLEAGRIQARQARALLPSGGFVLYVMGPALASVVEDRLAGFKEALDGSAIEWAQVYGDWDAQVAEKAVTEWLRIVLPGDLGLDLVVCQNDAMALGVKKALETVAAEANKPELTRVPITGLDGRDTFGKKLVDEGKIVATIIQPSSGGPAVEWVARALRGNRGSNDVQLPLTPYPDLPRLAMIRATSN